MSIATKLILSLIISFPGSNIVAWLFIKYLKLNESRWPKCVALAIFLLVPFSFAFLL
jgi:hypothetical protein